MKLLKSIDVNDVVFIDIETVRLVKELDVKSDLYTSWDYKLRYSREADKFDVKPVEQLFKEKAALYAEFGKIVCITIGKIQDDKLKLKSFYSDDERELLLNFSKVLESILSSNKKSILCGHAIKGFDVPYIMRRCLINRVEVPSLVDTSTAKPWDLPLLDTMELWKGSGFYGASLINIATAFGIPSPKTDMNGSETSEVYYTKKDGLERIKNYCEQDVLATANVFRAIRNEDFVSADDSNMSIKKVGVLEKTYNSKKLSKADEKVLVEELKDMSEADVKVAKTILEVAIPKN